MFSTGTVLGKNVEEKNITCNDITVKQPIIRSEVREATSVTYQQHPGQHP